MKKGNTNKLRAFSLLVIFALNIVVGFACSVGIDLGFNRTHHHEEESGVSYGHTHEDTAEHQHHEQAAANHSSHEDKDNCCKDEVEKFAKVDKQVPRSVDVYVPAFLFVEANSYLSFDVKANSVHEPNRWYFVQCHHPPIQDIRIAIQSFQI